MRPLLGFGIAFIAVLGACNKSAPRDCPRPKNVLLLVVDTLRADRLGCYGYERDTSPNIDALAARGTLFEQNYSQACWTVPSMISMFTGVSVTVEETTLPDGFAVVAEVLQEAGLETAAFPANDTLFKARGFERGFETFVPCPNVNGPTLAGRFAEWFDDRGDPDRPFFAWVQFIDPHDPYEPAPEFDVYDDPGPDEPRLMARWQAEQARVSELAGTVEPIDLQEAILRMRADSNHYDGEVRAVDDGVGRILATLREGGVLDDTLVILCSDHGEMLYEQVTTPYLVQDTVKKAGGLAGGVQDLFARGHRTWYYEELWNTPMIVAGPGMQARRSQALVANLDVFPTILDALDLGNKAWLEGQSLWCEEVRGHEQVFAHGHRTSAVIEQSGKKLVRYGKIWFFVDEDGDHPTEFFDLSADPHESTDLSEDQPEERDRLQEAILLWRVRSARNANIEITPDMLEGLRNLGYIDGESETDD